MNEVRYCEICSGELEDSNPTDICYSCQSIITNMNLGIPGFLVS